MSGSDTSVETSSPEEIDSEALFSLLGRAHTLEILQEACLRTDQMVRFGDLQEELELSPNTLSRRLEELVEMGFLERNQYDEIPPRVEYVATDRLRALRPTFNELRDWMEQYGSESLYESEN